METNLLSKESLNTALNMDYKTSNNAIGDVWEYYKPLYQSYYHYWPNHCFHYSENKFEQAFKILQKLIDKKLVKMDTVKHFIETLGDIQSVL